MIDLANDNSFQLKTYKVDHHSDGLLSLLMEGETIRFAFANNSVKLFISDKRILLEENGEKLEYSFVGLQKVDYLQMETADLSRQTAGVKVIFGLQNNQKLELTIEDEINPMALHTLLASKIFA